jgi:hypothetical protein
MAGHYLGYFVLSSIGWDFDPETGFPVDLNRQRDHLLGRQRFVGLGNGSYASEPV